MLYEVNSQSHLLRFPLADAVLCNGLDVLSFDGVVYKRFLCPPPPVLPLSILCPARARVSCPIGSLRSSGVVTRLGFIII